ncbi:Nucleotidyl transferase, partial [Pseudoxanthobacter soli DSM 19599]
MSGEGKRLSDDAAGSVTPVVLSGGTGTRLWPLSREAYPKQLLPLTSERTLIQETVRRCADPALYRSPVIITNAEHRFVIAEQLREMGVEPAAVVLEPVGRNTAAAATIAALMERA